MFKLIQCVVYPPAELCRVLQAELGFGQGLETGPAILVVPGEQDYPGLGPELEALLPLHHHQSHS